ncbi:hypothetical protein Ddc_09763 [Ditylenchus destructor]|nr:hypothetical protein Ddc_09763 [Ditylenchus destructor]
MSYFKGVAWRKWPEPAPVKALEKQRCPLMPNGTSENKPEQLMVEVERLKADAINLVIKAASRQLHLKYLDGRLRKLPST